MAKMVFRVGFSTIRGRGIFNTICQQNNINNLKLLANNRHNKAITCRDISTNRFLLTEKLKPNETFVDKRGNLVKKKGKDSPKIAIINLDGSKTSMYLKEAEKLAKIRRLELVEVGVVADKKLYKFSDLFEFESKSQSESEFIETKESNRIKKIVINSSILGHDLNTKINTMKKLLKKKNEILVDIMKKNEEAYTTTATIIKKIKDEVGSDYKIVTSPAKNKCRVSISLNKPDDEEISKTDKSAGEIELKSKTEENNESKTGKQS